MNSPRNYGLIVGHLLRPNYFGHFHGTEEHEDPGDVLGHQALDFVRELVLRELGAVELT